MTPGEYRAITEGARGAIARAWELAGRSAETRAIAAELSVIADHLCARARAERERARLLVSERDRTDPVAVRLGPAGPPQSRTYFSSSQTQIQTQIQTQLQTDAAIRQPSRIRVSAAAVPAPAIPGVLPAYRRV